MANVLNENEAGSGPDRRSFVKGATLGLVGAAAIGSLSAQAQSSAAGEVEDPQTPAGLKPGAIVDSRFPVFYESSVPEGMKLLTQYFKGMQQRDLQAMAQTLHYPFVTYERNQPVVIKTADDLMANTPASMDVLRKGPDARDGQVHFAPGSYDLLDNVQMHVTSPVGVGFSFLASRYNAAGYRKQVVHTLVGTTNNNGKWGIEFLSTIILPADQITETYDAENCINALHVDWSIHGEGRFEGNGGVGPETPKLIRNSAQFLGPNVTVSLGGNGGGSGAAGNQMAAYRVKGVMSRLRQTNVTQAQLDYESTPQDLAKGEQQGKQWKVNASSGLPVKWYESYEFPDTKILFGSNTKCHMYSGFRRYTASGTIISEHRFMAAAVFRDGVWHTMDIYGDIGMQLYRDHSNDDNSENA
jgi:hypothetical protein